MKVLVIGAGVAGLFFASFMADMGVLVLDKNEFAGRKLLATGNGRCNFTNLNQGENYYYSQNPDFTKHALGNFSEDDLIDYFNILGMTTTNLPSGRCYPETMSSKTVRDILLMDASENAKFIYNEEVTKIDFDKKLVTTTNGKYPYDKLVIATGGKTLKNSGSDGKIFDLIKEKIPLTPMTYGITNFETKEKLSKAAKGTKITGKASLIVEDKILISSTDDIIFQDYGLTGTAILDISNDLSIGLSQGKRCFVEVDLLPNFTNDQFDFFVNRLNNIYHKRSVEELLLGIINEKLIKDILKIAKIKADKPIGDLNDIDRNMLRKTLKHLRFEVSTIHDTTNAQVTIGGVDTRFVSPETFESTLIKDVHFIGEVLDVAGACGGYNIQWAASSARACADYLRSLNV